MFNFKSPYLWLSISLTCAALAFGLLPTLMPDAAFAEKPTAVIVDRFVTTDADATETVSEEAPEADPATIYKVVDHMPVFPSTDCGDIEAYAERKSCSDKAMLAYVYRNITYPEVAREGGFSGTAVVRFIVEKNGVVSNIEVVRDPGANTGAEAAKIVRKMRDDNLRWEPGLFNGKPVRVQYHLPVKFEVE